MLRTMPRHPFKHQHYTALVIGAGPAGLTLAGSLLPILGDRLAVLESLTTSSPRPLGRCLALTKESVDFLQTVFYSVLLPFFPICALHVRHARGSFGHLAWIKEDDPFGASIREGVLLDALSEDLQRKGCQIHQGCHVSHIRCHPYGNQIVLSDHCCLTADYVFLAHGKMDLLPRPYQRQLKSRDYHQRAWVTVVSVSQPGQEGHAFEWMTPYGPCAWIPLEDGRYGIVWVRDQHVETPSVAEFSQYFFRHFGHIRFDEPMRSFPLSIRYSKKLVYRKSVLVGHAAHMLHPIAAQGLNLTLRDIKDLTQSLRDGAVCDWVEKFPAYEARRQADLSRTLTMTNILHELLRSRICLPRGFGLAALDMNHSLKEYLLRCLTTTSSS